jgi:hypothetical protein
MRLNRTFAKTSLALGASAYRRIGARSLRISLSCSGPPVYPRLLEELLVNASAGPSVPTIRPVHAVHEVHMVHTSHTVHSLPTAFP